MLFAVNSLNALNILVLAFAFSVKPEVLPVYLVVLLLDVSHVGRAVCW